ncbi:MAG: ABC transporter permease, partial [Actinomycetota bacterium]
RAHLPGAWLMTPLATEPLIRWDWVGDHASEIGSRLIEHVELTVIAIVIGFAISFPLAVLAHRRRWTYAPITWVAGVLYTIPSLSLFVILVPITGLSATSVEIGLVSYTLLILIRNTVAGLGSVPADAVDSARGMGFSSRQMLWHVEVPLALPVMMAGVRIATVSTIGLVTVGSLIGRGGVGQFILEGLRTLFQTEIVLGAVLAAALAFAADGALLVLQRSLTPWAKGTGEENVS